MIHSDARCELYFEWIRERMVARQDAYVTHDADGNKYSPINRNDPGKSKRRLTDREIRRHVRGTEPIALYALSEANTCRWIAWDLDNHDSVPGIEGENRKYVLDFAERLRTLSLNPIVESSDGQGGYHIWLPLETETVSAAAFSIARWAIEKLCPWQDRLKGQPECFPAQGCLTEDRKFGNALRLPGRHPRRRVWSSILDRSGEWWIHWPDAIEEIISRTGDSIELIPEEAKRYIVSDPPPVKPSQSQQQIMFELYGPPLATCAPNRLEESFNSEAQWSDILEPHGWIPIRTSGNVIYWRRPGKSGPDHSATTGFCGDKLFVFSSSAYGFAERRAYSKYQAMTVLRQVNAFNTRRRTAF